jgi:hypothetical protein
MEPCCAVIRIMIGSGKIRQAGGQAGRRAGGRRAGLCSAHFACNVPCKYSLHYYYLITSKALRRIP